MDRGRRPPRRGRGHTKVNFAGPPTVYQRNQAAPYEIALALVLTGIPVLAAVLAAITRHTVTVMVMLVLTALLMAPAVYIGRTGVQDQRAGHAAHPGTHGDPVRPAQRQYARLPRRLTRPTSLVIHVTTQPQRAPGP